jgi:hypothetical protein
MEKFDGVRVHWDGDILRTKDMKTVLNLPKGTAFPKIQFEGELW